MTLDELRSGDIAVILNIVGKDNTKQFLENLGFVCGDKLQVVSKMCGNVIVNIKESRLAISKEMAKRVTCEV